MNLRKYICKDNLLTQLHVQTLEELLRIQAQALLKSLPPRYRHQLHEDTLLEMLLDRERKQSTGLGDGILVPHARVSGLNQMGLCFAVLAEPLACDTLDGKPVHLSCMVVAPAETPNIVIKVWSAYAAMLRAPIIRDLFLEASTPAELFEVLQTQDLQLELSLTASDMMSRPPFTVTEDIPLPEITFQMFRSQQASVPVIDPDRKLLGHITADSIFQFGMPPFFTQLQSVAFLKHFNPLEKYFLQEGVLTAKDVMVSDIATVPPSATLVEIIFLLSVKNQPCVYVLDPRNKLLGVINRLSVLDRAINF